MASRGFRQSLKETTPYLILNIAIATLGPLQYGYHLAELNAPQDAIRCITRAVPKLPNDSKVGLPDCIPMTDAAFATVSSVFTLGGLIGALTSGPLSSKYGRLLAMRGTSLFYIVGALIETLANAVPAMAIGRFVTGVGAGASTVIVPLYISEIAPPNERGLFGAMTQVSINVGILATQTLGFFLSHGSAWRWVLGAGAVVAGVHLLGLFAVPESPAWLAAEGNVTRARKILQRIRGKGFDISDETSSWDTPGERTAEEEGLLAQSEGTPNKKEVVHLSFFEVLKDSRTRPAIIAVVGIMFAQQLCGVNSIIMYSVSLLKGLLPVSSGLLTIVISIANLLTTIACSPLPDRLGRKACLLLSITGQGASSLALAFAIVYDVKIMSAVAVLFFVAFFAIGLGPVPFIMASELVGQEAVGATQSWSLGANYIATFIVAQFFPILNKALDDGLGGHGWVYFIFAALAVLSAAFVTFFVPETKGKRDADEVWGRTTRVD